MPLFSYGELLCIKPARINDTVAQFRYDIYGGSARNFICSTSFLGQKRYIQFVEAEMDIFFGDCVATAYPLEWNRIINKIASKLQERFDPSSLVNTMNSMMVHKTEEEEKWASPFMGLLGAAIRFKNDITIHSELKKLFNNSGMGYLFEALGHKKLLNNGTDYLLKTLESGQLSSVKENFPKFCFKYPLVIKIEDIQKLEIQRYCLPLFGNFPLVDAIIQPDTLIQFTMSPNTYKGASAQIEHIRSQLTGGRASLRMIFIVPQIPEKHFVINRNLAIFCSSCVTMIVLLLKMW